MKLFKCPLFYSRCVIIKDKFPRVRRYDVSVHERIYTNVSFRQERARFRAADHNSCGGKRTRLPREQVEFITRLLVADHTRMLTTE